MDDPRLELLTKKQVAARLKVGEKTVDRLVYRGHLAQPRHPAGGNPRWFVGDVEVYMWRLLKGDFDEEPSESEGEDGQSGTKADKGPPKAAKRGQAPKRPLHDDDEGS